ncbi:amidase [Apiospora phragmitis]|uniref:Amidase n=1 Tax=Apiospora phragmitis TaxID=2905665 RepID=A0ABR1TAV5_9PEZI
MDFDTLTTTATSLQRLLQEGALTSVQIIERYLLQIEQHNHALNAFISLAPREKLLKQAAALDEERRANRCRGPLHGIPIDCFITSHELGMTTTAGSWAFLGAKATKSSGVVQKLMDAGLIILGKTNMTEFCGMKMMITPGRSATAGQTLSPFVGAIEDGESILGHSVSNEGHRNDRIDHDAFLARGDLRRQTDHGPAGHVRDVPDDRLLRQLRAHGQVARRVGQPPGDHTWSLGPETRAISSKWDTLAVGFVDPNGWKLSPEMCRQRPGTLEQMVDDYEAMVTNLQQDGCAVKYPIELQDCSVLTVDGQDAIMPVASFDESPVASLEQLIQFNEDHAEQAMPPPHTDQTDLIKAQKMDEPEEEIRLLGEKLRAKARHIVDQVYEKENFDLIAAPVDSAFCIYAAAAGYPLGHVPLGQLRYNGRPFGLCLMAREDGEETLLRFMSLYEAAVPPRPVPDLSR